MTLIKSCDYMIIFSHSAVQRKSSHSSFARSNHNSMYDCNNLLKRLEIDPGLVCQKLLMLQFPDANVVHFESVILRLSVPGW